MRIIIECPENILHLEAGYIYADCLFDSSTLLQSGGGPYIFNSSGLAAGTTFVRLPTTFEELSFYRILHIVTFEQHFGGGTACRLMSRRLFFWTENIYSSAQQPRKNRRQKCPDHFWV